MLKKKRLSIVLIVSMLLNISVFSVSANEKVQMTNTKTASLSDAKQKKKTASLPNAQQKAEENFFTLDDYELFPENWISDLPDNDELFASYVEKVFYGDDEIAVYSNVGENSLKGSQKKLYQILKKAAAEIAEGTRTSTKITVSYEELGITKLTWTAEELGITAFLDSQGNWTQEGSDAFYKTILPDMDAVFWALRVDCPYNLYWYDIRRFPERTRISGWFSETTITLADNPLTYLMPVVIEYQDGNNYTTNAKKTGAAKKAAANAKAIVKKYEKEEDYDKLYAYLEEIKELNTYNSEAAGAENYPYGDPWQIIYVFDGDDTTNVVCEGYAKSFQYLCEMSAFEDEDIVCYSVLGDIGGFHMWNVITMDDGKNYLVDVTNCDNGTIGYPDQLFLAGGSGDVDSGYEIPLKGQSLKFVYDNITKELYDENILSLADSKYKPRKKPEIKRYPTASAVYGQTLKDARIEDVKENTKGTWEWKDPADTSVGNAGQHVFKARFIPEDLEAYKPLKDEKITINVSPKEIKPTIIIDSSTYEYTGNPITPEVTVKDGNGIIPVSEYTVTYSDNVEVGKASVKVENKQGGNYQIISQTAEFVIEKVNLANAQLELTIPLEGYVYDKHPKKPSVIVKLNGKTIDESWYAVSYAQNINAGSEAAVTIAGSREDICYGTASTRFAIAKKPINISIKAENKVYDGNTKAKVTAGIEAGQVVSGDEVNLTEITGVFADAKPGENKKININVGIAGKDASNYEAIIPSVTAEITPYVPVAVNQAIDNANKVKEGIQAINKNPEMVKKGIRFVSSEEMDKLDQAVKKAEDTKKNPMTKEQDQEIAAELNEAAEIFTKAIKVGIAAVNLADAEVELTIPQEGYIYDKSPKKPAVKVKLNGKIIDESWYTVSYTQNINAGSEAEVIITSSTEDICYGTASARFAIAKKPINILIKAENKIYDGNTKAKVTASIESGQVVSGDEVKLTEITGVFADETPGENKTIKVNAGIAGKDAANYEAVISSVTAAITPYVPVIVNQAIANANKAKEGVQAINKTLDAVEKGIRFVSAEEMNKLNGAIKNAEDAKKNLLTKEQDQEIASELNKAAKTFTEIIKVGTYVGSYGGNSSGGSSGGGGKGSKIKNNSDIIDSKKGHIDPGKGIITGAGDNYSHWHQGIAQDNTTWKLQYADGTYASGIMMADAAGIPYEQVDWQIVNGAWYAFGADGNAKDGWIYDVGAATWYFIDINVGMKTGWIEINGIWYYLNPDKFKNSGKPFGAMYHNEVTPDGYFVREDGSWDYTEKRQ